MFKRFTRPDYTRFVWTKGEKFGRSWSINTKPLEMSPTIAKICQDVPR